MADLFDPPLEDLRADLRRLSGLLSLLRSLRDFGSTDPPAANGDGDFGDAARGLRTTIRSLSPELAVLSGTLVLFIAGRFEHFVRLSFQTTCDSLAAKCSTFDELPEKMRKSLIFHTAEVVQSPGRFGFDGVQALGFISTLAANAAATTGLGQINSECLSITQNNMTPATVADLYKRIGITTLWVDLGKQAAMKIHFVVISDSEAESAARARLEELMSLRNQIAHPSATPAFPDPDKVLEYVTYVETFATVLTDLSRVHVAAFNV